MKSEEIAELLDCNVRNIREYRKELEEALFAAFEQEINNINENI